MLFTIDKKALFCSVSFTLGLWTPFGVSRLVCISACLHRGPRGLFRGLFRVAHVGGKSMAAGQLFPCTHPSTPITRLDKPQESFFKSSVRSVRESNASLHLWWHVLNELYCSNRCMFEKRKCRRLVLSWRAWWRQDPISWYLSTIYFGVA